MHVRRSISDTKSLSFHVSCLRVNFTKFLLKFGRRMPLIIGGVWQSAWFFVFAAAGTAKVPEQNSIIGKCLQSVFVLSFHSFELMEII